MQPAPAPPIDTQRGIADFLDRETARIDRVLEKKRAVLKLLGEREVALRERWAAECFDTYQSSPLRRLVTRVEQGSSPQCDTSPADPDEWGVLKTSAVSTGIFRAGENKRLPAAIELDERWIVREGDLLVVRGSGSMINVGAAAVARTEGRHLLLSDLIYRIHLRQHDPAFIAGILRARRLRGLLESAIRTDAGSTLKIRTDDLLDLAVPSAPLEQQQALAAILEDGLRPIREAQTLIEHQLVKLSERRQALITSAVSGLVELDPLREVDRRMR